MFDTTWSLAFCVWSVVFCSCNDTVCFWSARIWACRLLFCVSSCFSWVFSACFSACSVAFLKKEKDTFIKNKQTFLFNRQCYLIKWAWTIFKKEKKPFPSITSSKYLIHKRMPYCYNFKIPVFCLLYDILK